MYGTRKAVVELTADPSKLDTGLTTGRAKMRKWGSAVASDIKRTVGGAISNIGAIAGFGVVGSLAVAAKQTLELETRISRLGVAANATATEMAVLKQRIFEAAKRTGVSNTEILAGVESFVALTGRIDVAAGSMDTFAQVAQATGSNVADITTTAAAMFSNLGIGADQMKASFGSMLAQGKAGAVELKDMAQITAGLTPQFATFGTKGTAALAEMGALLQVMRSGFGSSSETATGLTALMTAMVKNSKELRGKGIRVFEGDGKTLRSVTDIAFDLIAKTKGNPAVLQKLLGRQEAYAALLPLMAKGRGEVEKLIAIGHDGAAMLDADFKRMSETPAVKMAKALESLKATVNETLAKHADTFARAIESAVEALKWLVDHKEAVLAVLAAWKLANMGGGAGGGIGGMLAGGGGVGGMLGGGRMGAVAGFAQRAATHFAIGYAVKETLGEDLGDLSDTAIGVTAALAAMPGPLGMIGKAAQAAQAGLLAVAGAGVDAQNRRVWGDGKSFGSEFVLERALDLGVSVGPGGVRRGGKGRGDATAQRSSASNLLTYAKQLGALNITGSDAASMGVGLDEAALRAGINADESYQSDEAREMAVQAVLAAQAMLQDPEFRKKFAADQFGVDMGGVAGGLLGKGAAGSAADVPIPDFTPSEDFFGPIDPRREGGAGDVQGAAGRQAGYATGVRLEVVLDRLAGVLERGLPLNINDERATDARREGR